MFLDNQYWVVLVYPNLILFISKSDSKFIAAIVGKINIFKQQAIYLPVSTILQTKGAVRASGNNPSVRSNDFRFFDELKVCGLLVVSSPPNGQY